MNAAPPPVQFAPRTIDAGASACSRSAPPGLIADLALALAAHSRSRGLVLVRMLCSRVRNSASKHLVLRDQRGNAWLIRVSDHPAPSSTGYDKPHFSLISRDGRSGYAEAAAFVDRVARGDERWTPPERDRAGRHRHHRSQKYASKGGHR